MIKERVATAEQRGVLSATIGPNSRDPLKGYTDGSMPKIHLTAPTVALWDINPKVIDLWDSKPEGKLLAQLFGMAAFDQESHTTIASLIFSVVIEIMKANNISVPVPQRAPNTQKTPILFLIHDLMAEQKHVLLKKGVWSSQSITFHTLPFEPMSPDFLFIIKGLTTLKQHEVFRLVHEAWHDESTNAFMDAICAQFSKNSHTMARETLSNFIDSMWIPTLDTKLCRNMLALSYCIFTSGNLIDEEMTWENIRNFLASRQYKLQYQNPGKVLIPKNTYTLCHSADHP